VRLPFSIPPFFRSFYFLSSLGLAGWLLFFDGNDLITQVQRRQKLADLERERDYYKGKIADVQRERDALLNNPDLLEKFARERYLMKRPREAVYVIVRDSADSTE
jgi:cell division protein DivIC